MAAQEFPGRHRGVSKAPVAPGHESAQTMAHGGSAGGVSAQPPYHALPSIAQRRALLNIAARRPYCTGLPGSGELWWHTITQAALRRKGLITDTNELTDAGRAMVERLTGRGV